jgi:hypothetical protein
MITDKILVESYVLTVPGRLCWALHPFKAAQFKAYDLNTGAGRGIIDIAALDGILKAAGRDYTLEPPMEWDAEDENQTRGKISGAVSARRVAHKYCGQ